MKRSYVNMSILSSFLMHKILLGAIIAAAFLLAYPSLMIPQQSIAQTTDQSTSTGGTTGSVLQCNTSTRAGVSMTIDGLNGVNGSPCVFEIKDWSFGVENPTTIGSATGGAGAGKVSFHDIHITKTTDSASPTLFLNSATGAHYKTVTIQMRKAGGDQHSAFLKFTFGTVFTTKIDWSGPGDEGPEESITFVYGSLGVQYIPQSTDGTVGTPITNCFDSVRNTIC